MERAVRNVAQVAAQFLQPAMRLLMSLAFRYGVMVSVSVAGTPPGEQIGAADGKVSRGRRRR